jgi:hypothetical protein
MFTKVSAPKSLRTKAHNIFLKKMGMDRLNYFSFFFSFDCADEVLLITYDGYFSNLDFGG